MGDREKKWKSRSRSEGQIVKRIIVIGLAAAALVAVGIVAAEEMEGLSVKKPYDQSEKKGHGGGGAPTIVYHNGAVMTVKTAVNVYIIYYGDYTANPADTKAPDIIDTFFTDLRTSPASFYPVNDTYYDLSGAKIVSPFNFSPVQGMVYNDSPPSQGTHISSKNMPAIIQHAINTPGGLPSDANGVYFILSAPSVSVSGFCGSFCAYHTSSSTIVSGTPIRYAVVPDPGNQCGGCDGNVAVYGQNATPRGDQGADEMTDSIIHELSETVTDPEGTGWFTSSGAENGDLCNYNYGTPAYTSPINGANANVVMNGNYYLIQKIWSNATTPQKCAP
jgi:Phosphate-induced protein 1 conserved region